MGVLMIRCPATGRGIPAGIEADHARFRSSPVFFSRSYCAFCRAEHEWFAQDAWVCEQTSIVGAGVTRQKVA
jgi:hypothetical protein